MKPWYIPPEGIAYTENKRAMPTSIPKKNIQFPTSYLPIKKIYIVSAKPTTIVNFNLNSVYLNS